MEENVEKGAQREPQGVEFTIYDRADSTPVGTAGLFRISHANGTAEFGIAIVSAAVRPRHRGRAARARLRIPRAAAANVLLETLEWNVAGLTAYERAGFRRVGVRRGAVMSRGRPTDVVLMDAVPDDFGESVLR